MGWCIFICWHVLLAALVIVSVCSHDAATIHATTRGTSVLLRYEISKFYPHMRFKMVYTWDGMNWPTFNSFQQLFWLYVRQ
jgi:hypothetical protein